MREMELRSSQVPVCGFDYETQRHVAIERHQNWTEEREYLGKCRIMHNFY